MAARADAADATTEWCEEDGGEAPCLAEEPCTGVVQAQGRAIVALKQAKNEARLARWVAVAAMLVASAAVVFSAAVMLRPLGGSLPVADTAQPHLPGQLAAEVRHSSPVVANIDIQPAPAAAEEEDPDLALGPGAQPAGPGWYRLVRDATLRKGPAFSTDLAGILSEGSVVLVAEQRGRRSRIIVPHSGWLSASTADGGAVLAALVPDAAESEEEGDPEERAQAKSAQTERLEALRGELLDTLNRLHHKLLAVPLTGPDAAAVGTGS